MLVGLTALSVETITNRSTEYLSAKSAMTLVPITLLTMLSPILCSTNGTCLWAAAWKTRSGRRDSNICSAGCACLVKDGRKERQRKREGRKREKYVLSGRAELRFLRSRVPPRRQQSTGEQPQHNTSWCRKHARFFVPDNKHTPGCDVCVVKYARART